MIDEILPATVACAETFDDSPRSSLFPVEAMSIARATMPRRRAFTTARACARDALRELGLPPSAIPRGHDGAPQWPAGVVGSITHCDGYRAAAVARASNVPAVGIDAEPNEPLSHGVLRRIASAAEVARLEELGAVAPTIHWDRLLFSAKEATYKAWSSLSGQWLGFLDAVADFYAASDTFTVDLLALATAPVDGREIRQLSGRWRVAHGLLATAVTISAPAPAAAARASAAPARGPRRTLRPGG